MMWYSYIIASTRRVAQMATLTYMDVADDFGLTVHYEEDKKPIAARGGEIEFND